METNSVNVRIRVPSMLRGYSGGAPELSVTAETVGGALRQLDESHSPLYRSICDDTGAVRRHVNVFVDSTHIRDLEGLDTTLRPGTVITIMPAVSGG